MSLGENFLGIIGEMIDRKTIRKSLKDLRGYCMENDIDYYPMLLDTLPDFAGEVNDYIKRKAREELHTVQFEDVVRFFPINPYDFLRFPEEVQEFGGVIGYA